jgi:hypothetical protein
VRNLSPAALAAIAANSGVEPAIIVRIFWGGTQHTNYCDRRFEGTGLVGKLLSISGIEDVVDINASSSSVNLDVTLDDSDGAIKSIYNTVDIHKVYVQVLQWFTYLPLADAFIIFEGEISSPIVWSEGSRTLKFDVVSKLEDREVGFSPEEGSFAYLPSGQIGKAWPIVFGTVAGSRLIPMNESPTAVLASGFGIVNTAVWDDEISKILDAINAADDNSRYAFDLGVNEAAKAASFRSGFGLSDDPSQAQQHDDAAAQYYQQSEQFAQDRMRLSIELNAKQEEYDFQKSLEYRVLPITQTNLPSGPLIVEMNNFTANVTIVGNAMIIHSITEKEDPNKPLQENTYPFFLLQASQRGVLDYQQQNLGQKFLWIDGGTNIKIFGFPRYFIASIGFVNIQNVWGSNKYGKAVIPRSWYIVDYTFFGSLPVTRIIFPTPLESYPGEWQFGDAEIDVIGSLGTNAVDIMIWAIQTFSGLTYDNATFVDVRNKVAAMPMNFVLDRRMNVMQFLKEIAFQARCAIWLNDRRFYLRFLPEQPTPVETVTDSDIEAGSLTLTSDPTESLVTKFTAIWKERHNQAEPNKVVYRYNIAKYGTREEEYDFFAYTNGEYVQKAAEFWMIRKSNSWKRVQCRVFLNKLRIEAFDAVNVTLSENIAANSTVVGTVTRSTFDADNDTVNLEIWMPVRLGEMTQYAFAYPGSTSEIYPRVGDGNILTGSPWQDARGEIVPAQFIPPRYQVTTKKGAPYFTSGSGRAGDEEPEEQQNFVVRLDQNELNPNRPVGIGSFNNRTRHDVAPVQLIAIPAAGPNAFYGNTQTRKSNYVYSCLVYTRGFDNDPVLLDVKLGVIRDDTILPNGFPLVVYRTIWSETANGVTTQRFEYWAQPAVWAPPSQT